MHADHADFIAASIEVSRRLVSRLTARTYRNDDSFGVGCPAVVEDMMNAPRYLAELSHSLFHEVGQGVVVVIDSLADLEVNVGIGRRAAHNWMVGI